MAWESGLVIRGGRYGGSTIGISDNLVGGSYAYAIGGFNDSAGQQVQGDPNIFYNYDFEKMIDCSSLFALSGADFADECIADIAIMDGNTLTGFFSLYATRSGLNVSVQGKVKNASGVIISAFSQGASITIDSRVETRAYLCLAKGIVNNYTLYGLYFNNNQHWQWAGMDFGLKAFAGAWINDDRLYEFFGLTGHIDKDVKKKSPEFGPAAKKKGGYNEDSSGKGSFDDSSDKITVDAKPYDNPFRTGFINGYYMNPTNLAKLSDALFPEPGIFSNDIPQMIFNLYTSLWNSKRIDYILDLLIVPVLPTYLIERHVNCGGKTLARFSPEDPTVLDYINGNPIEDCFVDKDCGTLSIPEYWANFLDFSGTRVKLFLPYVGYVDIEPEFIISGELHVWYRFNVFDGSFMCFVESTSGHSELEESLIGQYAGVAAIHIPLQSQDYSNKISGLISAIGTVGVGLAGGGMSASAGIGAAASLVNTLSQKPTGTHANGYNASSSYMSHRTPYLIIERQASQFSEKYPEEVGLPLYMQMNLSDCNGLTIAKNAHLDTIPCTISGKEKISQLLAEGIIL